MASRKPDSPSRRGRAADRSQKGPGALLANTNTIPAAGVWEAAMFVRLVAGHTSPNPKEEPGPPWMERGLARSSPPHPKATQGPPRLPRRRQQRAPPRQRATNDDNEDDGRASPPHRSYLIYALVHRTGWSTDNVGRRNRRASQIPSSTASGALHRRCLPAHRGYFIEHIVAPPPPEAGGASSTVSSTAS